MMPQLRSFIHVLAKAKVGGQRPSKLRERLAFIRFGQQVVTSRCQSTRQDSGKHGRQTIIPYGIDGPAQRIEQGDVK